MAGLLPDHRVRLPLLRSQWLRIAFIHWRFDPAVVQRVLPDGLTVDDHDGAAWVTLTPFRMVVAPVGPFGLPRLVFAETNLRTYVRGPGGRDGLWFLSILASSAAVTAAARLTAGAPYSFGSLDVQEQSGRTRYVGARSGGEPAYDVSVRTGTSLEAPSPLDIWLTGRWRAYTRQLGVLLETPVQHEPWPLRTATVEHLEETLTSHAGLPPPGEPAVVHVSDGVHRVTIGLSHPSR